MSRYRVGTICTTSILAVGLAMVCHESGHVVAGRLAGGTPTLMTSTEVKGDFEDLSPAGFVALGLSGSIVNVVLGAIGLVLLKRSDASAALRLFAWYSFSVNGLIVTTAMLGESLVGFGDWMTILRPFEAATPLRYLAALIGAAGLIVMVRRSGALLRHVVPPAEPARRSAEARRLVALGGAAAIVLVLGSSVASPIGATRGSLLALGAGLGPFIPMMFATRFVSRFPSETQDPPREGGRIWLVGACVTVVVLWFLVGPGIAL